MPDQVTLEQLEQQISYLPIPEQLKLIAHISEQLSFAPLNIIKLPQDEKNILQKQREKELNALLALCDAAADKWEGSFNAVKDIHKIRRERDEQIWSNK